MNAYYIELECLIDQFMNAPYFYSFEKARRVARQILEDNEP